MEREKMDEDAPSRAMESSVEAPAVAEEERLERLLRGVVHTVLATYRLRGQPGPRPVRRGRQRRGRRFGEGGVCC